MLTAVHPTLSRRRLLVGGLCLPVLAATACTDDPEQPPPDPDRAALETALDVEQTLLETVVRWDGENRQAQDFAAVVATHVTALESTLGIVTSSSPSTPSPSPSASDEVTSLLTTTEVLTAADIATNAHTRALRTATATISPMLASIAASDAAIAATLRRGTP